MLWYVFTGRGAVQSINHLKPMEPPEWHKDGWGFGVMLSLVWINKFVHKVCVDLHYTLTLN